MHRPAPFSHHSSVACPHKAANRIRVHTNPINTLTLAEAHYSHGVTFGDTPAVAGCMDFPVNPAKRHNNSAESKWQPRSVACSPHGRKNYTHA
ncbi:hypothetical protein TCDM_12020 [Trypanosoma cruzi Dm28c]|uniref:Uncharacterized protein n=1 Tax=Trypanosoma cruzi Dm28c TaxID=1416333 RepID=V5AYY0_TRYCR|nr:hypothetical protein TCDM_12020 [Trypanosoma cruzi Dm28c]